MKIGSLPLSIRSGITGMDLVVASTRRNSANKTRLPRIKPMTQGLDQGSSLPPRLSPRSCTEMAITSSIAPEKSMRRHATPSPSSMDMLPGGLRRTRWPKYSAMLESGTWARKHQRHPMVSAMVPPKAAPQMAPKPKTPFCMAWYMPRRRKGIMSELIMVAGQMLVAALRQFKKLPLLLTHSH